MADMPLNARLYADGSDDVQLVDLGSARARLDDRSLLWVDLDPDPARLAQVDEEIGLGQAARELADAPDHDIAFHADTVRLSIMAMGDAPSPGEPVRLHLVLARNIVVSIHEQPIRGLADPVRIVARDPRFGRLDAGRFAGLLLDGVLHGYDDVLEDIERDIDGLDERALRRDTQEDLLHAMVGLRRRIAVLRRALAPARAVFASLVRPIDAEPSPIGTPDPELLAHLERTIDAVERSREQLLGSFDILMTRTGQRTNDVVRVLTVVSAVLLPSVVIAGVMGMNFSPAFFDEPALFFVVVALMLALAVATLGFARWRR